MSSPVKPPGSDHPITIVPTRGRVMVKRGGIVIAESTRALTLTEASYPPVQYIPRADARLDLMTSSAHRTHCPYKGDAAYYNLDDGNPGNGENAVWTYEQPFPAVAAIAGHLAFYPNKVDSIEIAP
ncbi:DUF427 domain-containing protein [Dongia sp.]|uniref:DUF427 domain-containing protein n=1 Tax=Dongia sp. TaxID=1977262 RepID=UPI0035B173E1